MAPRNPRTNEVVASTELELAPSSGSGAPIVVRAGLRRRPPLWRTLLVSLVSMVIGVAALLATMHHARLERVGSLAFLAANVFAVAMLVSRGMQRAASGEVHVGRAGIALDGRPIVAREQIRSAIVGGVRTTSATVRVGLRDGGDVEIDVASVEWARAILDALGLDARRVSATFSGVSRANESPGVTAVIAGLAVVAGFAAGIPAAFACGVSLFLLTMLFPTYATVGTDGVFVRWFFERRYFPFADIVRVERMPARVRLQLESGKHFDVVFRHDDRSDAPAAGELAERIVEAIARRGVRADPIDPTVLARPTGIGTRAWIASLHDVAREGTFRQTAVTIEQLWNVVEDSTSPVDARAAAAIALRRSLDDRGRKRLRVAAQATAAPHLRLALERAADAEDDALVEAIDELHAARKEGRGA